MSSSVPYTRELAYVLRERLKDSPARFYFAVVASVPDARHVAVTIDGTNVTVPRLKSYSAPAAGDPALLLVQSDLIIALGSVK